MSFGLTCRSDYVVVETSANVQRINLLSSDCKVVDQEVDDMRHPTQLFFAFT